MEKVKAFTLTELLVAISILIIVAGIGIQSYVNYTKRARYAQIVSATIAVKAGVQDCYNTIGKFKGCNSDILSIPPAITKGNQAIKSMIVKDGVIMVKPNMGEGIKNSDILYLSPKIATQGIVEWTLSGRGVKRYAQTSSGKAVNLTENELIK